MRKIKPVVKRRNRGLVRRPDEKESASQAGNNRASSLGEYRDRTVIRCDDGTEYEVAYHLGERELISPGKEVVKHTILYHNLSFTAPSHREAVDMFKKYMARKSDYNPRTK